MELHEAEDHQGNEIFVFPCSDYFGICCSISPVFHVFTNFMRYFVIISIKCIHKPFIPILNPLSYSISDFLLDLLHVYFPFAKNMKKFHRFNQVVSQTLGRAEKSETLTDELINVDQKVTAMVKALEHTKKKLIDSLRSLKSASLKEDGNVEKRRKALEEYKLSQAVINDAKTFEGGLLSDVMTLAGEALGEIVEEIVQHEMHVEQHVLEKLTKFHDELRNINNQKEKLKKLVLDMDSAKTRLATAQARSERLNEIQDELDNAQAKVESCKDQLACDLYTLASKEVDMAVLFRALLQLQIDFHRTALKRLEDAEPLVVEKINSFRHRPVYGCPLEDHLRYSEREIALVLEVCCSGLCLLGLKDEGLFRISGNATKVRKLKAAFDAGEIDLGDFDRDPHSIAGALKSYLRELPDSLMTNNLYREWMSAVSIPVSESRLAAIRDVITKLPKCNYANLRYLIKFLAKLAENQQATKMSSQNLAIVMAPNMIWSTIEGEGFAVNSSHGTLVEILISNANYFFPGDVKFTSPLVASIVDKTGGFLENGPLPAAVALSLNVAKALAEDGNGMADEQLRTYDRHKTDTITQLKHISRTDMHITSAMMTAAAAAFCFSPAKHGSSRRPKQPAPLPPPAPYSQPKSARPLSDSDQRTSARDPPLKISTDRALLNAPSSNEEDDDDFADFSPTDFSNRRRPLPPRRPQTHQVSSDPQPESGAGPCISVVDSGTQGGFTFGHKKTKSLDRPLRPPPKIGQATTDSMSTSIERPKNGSVGKFPKEEDLDALLLAGFSDSTSGKGTKAKMDRTPSLEPSRVTSISGTLPRPQQPQRPPLPNKMVLSAVTSGIGQAKGGGASATVIRVSQSDESDDDEPVITSMDNEHIYYDVPSGQKQYSLSYFSSGQNQQDSVSLLSVSKKPELSQVSPRRTTQPSTAVVTRAHPAPVEGNNVAQKRESLLKLFASDQQVGQGANGAHQPTGAVSLRPRPPVPSKPKSGDFTDHKDVKF